MTRAEADRYILAAHEAGHAVSMAATGFPYPMARIGPDGGCTEILGDGKICNEADARAAAISFWAGQVAEGMIISARVKSTESPRKIDRECDEIKLIGLAMRWGQPDPVAWSIQARERSRILLAANFSALTAATAALRAHGYINWTMEPLASVRHNEIWYRPF